MGANDLRGCYRALVVAVLRQAIADALIGDRFAEMALRHPFWSSWVDTLHADGSAKLQEMLATEKGRTQLRKRLEGVRL